MQFKQKVVKRKINCQENEGRQRRNEDVTVRYAVSSFKKVIAERKHLRFK